MRALQYSCHGNGQVDGGKYICCCLQQVPVPVRFFSILLVPPSMEIDLIEIGRSIGTLMSNKVCLVEVISSG